MRVRQLQVESYGPPETRQEWLEERRLMREYERAYEERLRRTRHAGYEAIANMKGKAARLLGGE